MGVLECRQKTIILKATAHAYQDTNHPVKHHFHASSRQRCACQSVSDDQMIVDAGWVAKVETAFVSLVSPEHIQLARTPDDAARADHLQAILTHRLYVHVNTRKHACTGQFQAFPLVLTALTMFTMGARQSTPSVCDGCHDRTQ
jgi:hypothetical protein